MRAWVCRVCGDRAETSDDKVAYFHRCHPPTRSRRRLWSLPELEDTTVEEQRSAIFESLAGEVPEDEQLRRL